MSERWLYVDGGRRKFPERLDEFVREGWHWGVSIVPTWDLANWDKNREITQWCQDRFDPHSYVIHLNSIWFIHEQDALLCQLRWSR